MAKIAHPSIIIHAWALFSFSFGTAGAFGGGAAPARVSQFNVVFPRQQGPWPPAGSPSLSPKANTTS